MTKLSLKSEFEASAEEVDSIFTNFRTLHEIYNGSIESLKQQLASLPVAYTSKIDNAKQGFEKMSGTVLERQQAMNSQLYSQAVVLLMGNAESILESSFKMLVIDNFRKIKLQDNRATNFSLQEVLAAKSDTDFGKLLFNKLESNKNPSEKLSFQNMQQLEKILKDNFNIRISSDYVVGLHEFWQLRHVIIHKQGYIDSKFISNLKAAGIDTKRYKTYRQVKLKQADYERCFSLLSLMFEEIDKEIDRLGLDYSVPF